MRHNRLERLFMAGLSGQVKCLRLEVLHSKIDSGHSDKH
jgi:hypothetical protein